MSNAVSLPNHTFSLDRLSPLCPVLCTLFLQKFTIALLNGSERMTVENISWSNVAGPAESPDHKSDAHPTEQPRPACAPSEGTDQPAHRSSLFTVCCPPEEVFGPRLSEVRQWRIWLDCKDAHIDLSLDWSHVSEGTFSHGATHVFYNISRFSKRTKKIRIRLLMVYWYIFRGGVLSKLFLLPSRKGVL